MDYKQYIRDIKDFPKEGIVFKDMTPLWLNPQALEQSTQELAEHYSDIKVNKVIGAEARGFVQGPLLAIKLNAGFVPVRKPGKLPAETISESYELEYGTDSLEIHKDAIEKGDKVLIFDDLVATGGTISAIEKMVEELGGEVVGVVSLIELTFLEPQKTIKNKIFSLIKY